MINPSNITTITDLKKSPKHIFDLSKEQKRPIVIYNNSQPIGIIMDTTTYTNMENTIDALNEKIFELESAIRLETNTNSWTSIEVQGANDNIDLNNIPDEWT